MSKKYIAEKLREYREKNGIAILEVAEKFNKSIKTIYAWESGQGQPDADTLIQLCMLYKINDFQVLSEDSSPPTTPDQTELVHNYNELNEVGQQALLEQSRMMRDNPTYKKAVQHEFVSKDA